MGADTGQEHVGYLALGYSEREPGDGEQGRPAEYAAQGPSELRIGDRVGRAEIDGTAQVVTLKNPLHGAYDILPRYPAQILPAGAEPAAKSQPEYRPYCRHHAARGGQHDADSHVDHSDSGVQGGGCGVLPLDTDHRRESRSRARHLRSGSRRPCLRSSRWRRRRRRLWEDYPARRARLQVTPVLFTLLSRIRAF